MTSVALVLADPAASPLPAVLAAQPGLFLRDVLTAPAARTALLQRPPQVALVELPGDAPAVLSAVGAVAAARPALPFLALARTADFDTALAAFRAGCTGYLLHDAALPARLGPACAELLAGGAPLSPAIARQLVRHVAALPPPAPRSDLTAREREVLAQLAAGLTYRQIAQHLAVSEDTVRAHIRNLYRKLGVHSRTAATLRHFGHA